MTRADFDRTHSIRTDGQVHLAPLNLDGMTPDELAVAAEHPALHAEVRRYADHAVRARTERLAGRISEAMKLELCCNYIHDRYMPKFLRW
jgi:hypothetical protein